MRTDTGTPAHGTHVVILPGVIYLPESQFADPRNPAWIAFFAFGEFQHDTLGGNLTEAQAQQQLDAIITKLPAPYNTWKFEHGAEH